jgi:hypothetical protein
VASSPREAPSDGLEVDQSVQRPVGQQQSSRAGAFLESLQRNAGSAAYSVGDPATGRRTRCR